MRIIDCIMRHTRIKSSQFFVLSLLYNRIHKETACITQHLRIRQFCLSNFYDDITKLLGCRLSNTLSLERRTDITIIQIRTEGFLQTVNHMRHQILILPLMLKFTLTVTILAVSIIKHHYPARSYLNRFHLIYNILGFHTIGTNILNRTGTYFTRNNTQIFNSMIAMLYGISYHIIKHLTTTTGKEYPIRIAQSIIPLCSCQSLVVKNLNTHNSRMEHCTSIITGQQEIATTAQNEQWLICLCQQAHYLSGFLYRFILQKSAAFSINPECIVSQKAIVTNILHIWLNYYY